MGAGPYIYIGLPSDFADATPYNATRLLEEWEVHLDPLERVREVAGSFLGEDAIWKHGKWFVEPSRFAIALIREVAKDHEVIDMLNDSKAILVDRPEGAENDVLVRGAERRFLRYWLVRGPLNEPEVNPLAVSFLLGMSVVASIYTPIGFHGRGIHDARVEAAAEEERQK